VDREERRSSAGFGRAVAADGHLWDVEHRIRETMLEQCVGRCGWALDDAQKYVDQFLTRSSNRKVVEQLDQAFRLQTKQVLEIGSGLGNTLIELRSRGIDAIGIEPPGEWVQLLHRRLQECRCPGGVVCAYGEALPFATGCFDVVMSFQVLEHVKRPELVLGEVDRVLRSGGICYIDAPNYFSFAENHYRVLWLPGLPRRLGGWYLRLRGRNPTFYVKHVNNITFLRIVGIARQLGWEDVVLANMQRKLADPDSIESPAKRFFAKAIRVFGFFPAKVVYWASNLARAEVTYVFRKK